MNFIKTFLAGLLAVVVGTFLVFFLWIFILLGIAGSMEKSVAVHPESILKIDFSEVLTDAPSSDPLAGLDLMTLQTQRQLPLLKALRALEAARDDDRIKGIYLRMNGTGGVTGSAILEELREALVEFKQSGKFIVQRNLFAGRLLPGFGRRQDLHAARGHDGVGRTVDEPDVLQGAAG